MRQDDGNQETKVARVGSVKLDSIVAMKLMQIANNRVETAQIGYLMGIVQEETAEVTNCYPIMQDLDQEYQEYHDRQMMGYAKKHSLDYNKVGLYLITDSNEQLSLDNFDSLSRVQYFVKYAFILTYSLALSKQGHPMPFQAHIINEKYAELFTKEDIPNNEFLNFNSKHDKIYRTIPVELLKTPLTQQILFQYQEQIGRQYQQTSNKTQNNLESFSKQLLEVLDDHTNQADKINYDTIQKKQKSQNNIIANDLLEYYIQVNKVNVLTEVIKKEVQYNIESEAVISKLII